MRNFASFVAFLVAAGLLTSCIVKPPGGNPDDLGAPVSADDINAAIDDATDVPQSQAYHVGDFGTKQKTESVLGNSAIDATYQFKVTEINTENIVYSILILDTGETGTGTIPIDKSAPASTAMKFVKKTIKAVASFFKKIEIENTKAIGEDKPVPKSITHKVHFYQSPGESILDNSFNKILKAKGYQTTDDSFTSQYFGLSVTKHKYLTANCSQIADCKVNAVKIEYNEARTYTDGKVLKVRVLRELTKEVPGLFLMLDYCESAMVVDGDNQLPLTICNHVKNFTFGSN